MLFPFSLAAVLGVLFASANAGSAGVCNGCSVSPWNRYAFEEVNGTVYGFLQDTCSFQTTVHGDPRYYRCPGFAPLPPATSPRWGEAGLTFPDLEFDQPSRLPQTVCSLGPLVDTNWFQLFVYVPSNVILTDVQLRFTVDDGARVTVINSIYPLGAPLVLNPPSAPGSYMYLNQNQLTHNLASVFATGEINRIVVTQIDDCIDKNGFAGVVTLLNGIEITNVTFPPSVLFDYVSSPSIRRGESTNLVIQIGNSNDLEIEGATMTHLIPSQLVPVPGVFTSLPGCPILVATTSSIVMNPSVLPPMLNCTYTFSVAGQAGGLVEEFIVVNAVNSAPGVSALDSLFVMQAPHVIKSYSASDVTGDGIVQMTISIENLNALDMLETAFTDNLPTGLLGVALVSVQSIPATSSCPPVTVSGGIVSMAPTTFSGLTRCVYVIDVQPFGTTTNTVVVTALNAPSGESNDAVLRRSDSPLVTLAFSAGFIPSGGSTSVTLTIRGNGSPGGFTYTLPLGLTVSGLTAPAGCPTVSENGVSIFYNDPSFTAFPSMTDCIYSGTVTSSTVGLTRSGFILETTPSASVANVPLYVTGAPFVSVTYSPGVIANGATSVLTIVVSNSNGIPLTGIEFESLLTGHSSQIIGPISAGPNCPSANATSNSIGVSGGTIAASSSCSYVLTVLGTLAGSYGNPVSVAATNAPAGFGTANLDILNAPSVLKEYDQPSFPLSGSNMLRIVISNPNPIDILGLRFTDTLNPGIRANSIGFGSAMLSGTNCIASQVQATALDTFVVTGARIPAGGACLYELPIVGTAAGVNLNSVQVTSTNAPPASDSDVAVTVMGAPIVGQSFQPGTIALGGVGSYRFSLENPNGQPISGGTYSGFFPDFITSAAFLLTDCAGGLVVVNPGSPVTFQISGVEVTANSACRFELTFTTDGTTLGPQTMSVSTFSSSNTPPADTSPASITIMAAPILTKTYAAPDGIPSGASTTLTITVQNSNTATMMDVELIEVFPAGLVAVPGVPNGIIYPS